jgi:UDP-N-acetylenolpyruvoylglucosamine reductase
MEIKENIELKSITWMKVGGKADYYAEVKTKDELQEAFRFAQENNLPILYIGQGSNMIVPDEGIRGLVIRLMNKEFAIDMEYSDDKALVNVEGGMIVAKLIREARKQRLNGLDNFVGIPGVIGASIRGNIGIPEEEICELVHEVEIFDGNVFRILEPKECDFIYRGSKIKDEYWLVWSVKLLIRKGDPPHKDEWLLERVAKQPKGHSCGSFFKNPDPEKGLYAGKLIDEAGLKGKHIGGALISELHGNFLMNDGTGTASEILQLARETKQEILDKKGILLENEVLLYDQFGQLLEL